VAADVNVRDVGGGVVSPGGYIIRTGIRVLSGSHGPRGPNQSQRDRFRAAGGTIEVLPGKGNPRAYYWQGIRISGPEATRISQGYRPGVGPGPAPPPSPPPSPPPPRPPIEPGGPTFVEQSSWAPWLFQYGRGPLTRGRKRKKKKLKRTYPQSNLPRPWTCGTDTECEASFPGMDTAFVGPYPSVPVGIPSIPDVLPRVVTRVLPRIAVGVLSRVLWLPGLILFPSRTADDDILISLPQPQQLPRGPRTRTRRRVRAPYDPEYPVGPVKVPQRRPDDQPRQTPRDLPRDLPNPYIIPRPWEIPKPRPGPRPVPLPSPRPGTPKQPNPWPYLIPLLTSIPHDQPGRLTRPRDRPLQSPLDQPLPFAQPIPQRADQCDCTQTKRKKRKKGCVNPITSKRTFARGGAKFRTTTRKLICQA